MTERLLLATVAVFLVLALGLGIYTLAAPKKLELHGTKIENPTDVGDTTLIGRDGETHRLADWQGKLVLVFFGYANCPDVCPLTMAKLARTYEALGSPEDLQVIMVTVDPERDTAEQISNYAKGFNADFVGLTGSPEAIAQASARFYVGAKRIVGAEGIADGTVAHSSHVTLVDRTGRMRLIYTQDKLNGMLQEDLESLLAHKGSW